MIGMILKRLHEQLPLIALVSLASVAVWALSHTPVSHAQTPPAATVCRAAMIIDRSGSVDQQNPNNMQTIRTQIRRLFQPTGLYDDKIELAFWSFSSGSANSNYNAPFHGYVSSRGITPSFDAELNRVVSSGSTNYQQAFAYNGTVRNPALGSIIDATDILVFMTDGEPNQPPPNNNALQLGRQAAQRHLDAGRVILGGAIGLSYIPPINYTITGDSNNSANTFSISTNYDDLSVKLKQQIADRCKETVEPCPYNPAIPATDPNCKLPAPYSLTPRVEATSTVMSGNDSAGFNYRIDNNGAPSENGQWSVKRVVVRPGQSVDPLYFNNGENYRDNYSCGQLDALVGGQVVERCSETAAGTRVFGSGTTTLSAQELGAAAVATVNDDWQVGTKLCYVLTIDKPTENDTPTNRYSRAACVVVGRRPTVQVHGGDVIVGKYFRAEDIGTVPASVKGSLTTKVGSTNKTFGSWVEYGIFAPGAVSGVASASGLQGGYDGQVANNQELWSNLTFANAHNDYGQFTSVSGMGQAANMAAYLLRGRAVAQDLTTVSTIAFNGNVTSGLYQKTNGNLGIDASTLEKGKTVIVNVPNDTVTIQGNLSYAGGAYQSIGQIPQLIIIAKNIVINGNVANVDAWLLAQAGDGSGGTIRTCDVQGALTASICSIQLTVNGPIMAKELLLRRTGGSGTGGASGDAAEVFNLRADAYLWAYGEGRSSLRAQTTYTKELPPQF